jgi:glycerol kinase
MRVDGGITANKLCMQLQADVMGIEIVCPQIRETTALGAAYAAGLAVGFWSGTEEISKQWKQSQRWKPETTSEKRMEGLQRWRKAVERSLRWVE